MDKAQMKLFYETHRYRKTYAYLCWFIGFHYLYLGKPAVFLLYFFTLGGFGIWCLVDMFRIPAMVDRLNAQLKVEYSLEHLSE